MFRTWIHIDQANKTGEDHDGDEDGEVDSDNNGTTGDDMREKDHNASDLYNQEVVMFASSFS